MGSPRARGFLHEVVARVTFADRYFALEGKPLDFPPTVRLSSRRSPPSARFEFEGTPGFDPKSKGVHWKFTTSKLDELDIEGRIHWPEKRGAWPAYKRYWSEVSAGTPMQTVWTDIPPINSQAKERLGYPTQKPERLLRRIIRASSDRDDVVADFFCGCGTTLAVAQQEQRRWIGCDVSPSALKVVRRRLERLGASEAKLVNYPYSLEELETMNPFEFENYVVDFINGTHAPPGSKDQSAGIDGFTMMYANPIQVKQMKQAGKPIIQRLANAIRDKGKAKGYVFALGFSRDAHDEVAQIKMKQGIEIGLVKVQDVVQQEPLPEFP